MSEELKNKAIELGIQNAETLTVPQLKKAIQLAGEKLEATNELIAKAESLGLEIQGKTDEELSDSVAEAESLAKDINDQARQAELLAILSEYLGIADVDVLTKDEVVVLLESKKAAELLYLEQLKSNSATDVSKVEVVEDTEGKTTKSFKLKGKEYVFKDDAPAAFRYLGQFRTQEQWMEDEDAVELMVAGNLNFLTLKK